MAMTGAQLATMRTFVRVTLKDGALPLIFPDPVTRDSVVVRFAANLPAWSSYGAGIFDVTLDLEIVPVAAIASVFGNGALDFSDADNSGLLALLEDI